MASAKINLTEWLDELARLSNRSDEGLTSGEWAEQMGCSKGSALVKLQKAQVAGWLVTGRRLTTALDGRPSTAPVYRIVKPKK
jgi:predicted DNA-binding protein (UPF0251 family)